MKRNETTRRDFLKTIGLGAVSVAVSGSAGRATDANRPNILFCIADDWSWPHASIAGDKVVKTPTFDRIAREGVLFRNAFVTAPSCTPSRGSIVTGQYHWRLEEGGNLWSTLPARFDIYPDLLEKAGYHVGCTRKGWGPNPQSRGTFIQGFPDLPQSSPARVPLLLLVRQQRPAPALRAGLRRQERH
ncbi:MAG TPA: sulfatase-like hydrolase/transferase [Sedimentisphaerales bacterium]|nr:sulfatase-like hydrolase/transferase [Sedimentisphaerales bacterium]